MPGDHGFWKRTLRWYAKLSATWTLEIVAVVFSTLCLVALIGTLAYAEGRQVMVWHGVTLNALVALLSTASKLSALSAMGAAVAQSKWILFAKRPRSLLDFETIDLASRGVSGSVQLLFRGRRIALMGAVAFVLAVAYDPFTQQLVQYRNEVVYSASLEATVPRAQRYSRGTQFEVALIGSVKANADFSMQAAVYNGLAATQEMDAQQGIMRCPSANCTWPAFESLAVCSTCQDLQSELQKATTQGPIYTWLSPDNDAAYSSPITGYKLPNGLYINNPVPDDEMGNYAPGPGPLRMTTLSTAHPNETVTMQELNTLIWSITTLKVGTASDPNVGWPNIPVIATECGLYYCVRSFNDNTTNNRALETSTEDLTATRSPDSWVPLGQGQVFTNHGMKNYSSNSTADLAYDPGYSALQRTDLMLGDNYNISQVAVNSIGSLLSDTFSGGTDVHSVPSIQGYYIEFSDTDTMYSPPSVQALYDSQDLHVTFESLATSMTNALRLGADNATAQLGSSGVSVTVYRIWWPWISLPIAVLLASTFQLIVIMVNSRDVPLWKSSTLATLSRGHVAAKVLEGAGSLEEMQDAAGRTRVDLFQPAGNGRDPVGTAYTSSLSKPGWDIQMSSWSQSHEDVAAPRNPLLRDQGL